MMTPEERFKRIERVMLLIVKSGDRARKEFREKINILTSMQMRNEEAWRAESRSQDEKIGILIDAQIKNEAAWRAESNVINQQIRAVAVAQAELTESQKLTDRALRAFINSLHKGGNGKS